MVRLDGAETRRQRMESMVKRIMSALNRDGEIPLTKTVAQFEYDFGLTKEKVIEYLETPEKLGRFTIDRERDKICKASQDAK